MTKHFKLLSFLALTIAMAPADSFAQSLLDSKKGKTKIELVFQGKYVETLDLDSINGQIDDNLLIINNNVSIGGGNLHFGVTSCFEDAGVPCGVHNDQQQQDVTSYTDDQIVNRFRNYVRNNLHIPVEEQENFTGFVMLDMEHPIHPRNLNLYLYDEELFGRIVHEYTRRIAAARTVLPNAKIGLYGPITPNMGPDSKWDEQIKAVLVAADLGLFQDTNYIVANVYTRFGPDDRAFNNAPERIADRALSLAKVLSRIQGISRHKQRVYPLMSFVVYNGNSVNDREPADIEYLQRTIAKIEEYNIRHYGYWEASDVSPIVDIEDVLLELYANGDPTGENLRRIPGTLLEKSADFDGSSN